MLDVAVVPSLPARSFAELTSAVATLAPSITEFQVDVVDGHFATPASWPFTETDLATAWEKLQELPDQVALELDCMCMHPEQYREIFSSLGIKRVIIHIGSTECLEDTIVHGNEHGYEVGIALTNDVPLQHIGQFIEKVALVQVMGIETVGQQGQPFDERTLDTVRTLRTQFPELTIAVDGSVNETTIPRLKQAGANRFAPGSAVLQATDPVAAYQRLQTLVL